MFTKSLLFFYKLEPPKVVTFSLEALTLGLLETSRLSMISGCRAALVCSVPYSREAGELGELQLDTFPSAFAFSLL